jgi:PAS domain S-box-containing protein
VLSSLGPKGEPEDPHGAYSAALEAQFVARLMDASEDSIKILDLNGRPASAVGGPNWLDFWSGQNRVAAEIAIAEARAGRVGKFTGLCPERGLDKWWDVTATAIRDAFGAPERLLVVSRDATERVEARRELAKSEERYRILGAALPGVTWTANPEGLLDDIVGFSASSVLGSSSLGEGWLDLVHDDDRAATLVLWQAAIDAGTPYEAQFRMLSEDGGYRWQLVRALPQRDPSGQIVRWVGVNIDVDEQHRAFEHEQRIAFMLQEASLPTVLPALPDVYLCAYYRPGNSEATIGGDWYDAFLLEDGRLVLTIGDVLGKGLAAAVTMGKIRQAMRAVARLLPEPNALLDAADHTVRSDSALNDIYATALAGIYDPHRQSFTFASAGHPGPVLRRPDGSIEEFWLPGTLLGMRDGNNEVETVTVELPPGSALVFVTDGLLEATRDLDDGIRRINAAMCAADVWAADNSAHALVTYVLAGQPATDDVAVLVAEFGPS